MRNDRQPTAPIRVLVVDDHPVVRAGVRCLLADADDGVVAGEAADGRQAVAEAERRKPHVILMDLRLPELAGVEATRRILAAQPEVAVVVLTSPDAEAEVLAAIEAGALGYVAKTAERTDFRDAVRRVARGEAWLPPDLTRTVLAHLRPHAGTVAVEPLTPREHEVLELLARGSSNRKIAARLGIAEITVRTHVGHILGKLGVSNRVEAALYALQRGLVPLKALEAGGPPARELDGGAAAG